jgi:hypothetical protein
MPIWLMAILAIVAGLLGFGLFASRRIENAKARKGERREKRHEDKQVRTSSPPVFRSILFASFALSRFRVLNLSVLSPLGKPRAYAR